MTTIETGIAVRELAAMVQGPVLQAVDEGFADEVACFNAAVVHRPAVVVGATSARDVQAAVRWAAARGMTVSVQATGHGATRGVDGGLLVTTRRMQDLHVDAASRLATVGAGVQWRRVIDAAAPHGLAPLNGSSSNVGAVGYTLGGGLAVLGRTFGFASDWVVAFEAVTADGALVRVTADDEPELFWALRGGKPDAAIVTSMTVELLPVSGFYGGSLYYDGAGAADILRTYAAWCAGLPDEMTTAIALMRLPALPDVPEPLRERFTVHLRVAYVGDPGRGAELMQPMRAIAPAIIDDVVTRPYTEVDRVHNDPEQPLPFDYAATVLPELGDDAIDALMAAAGPGADIPVLMLEIRHLGGRMDRPADDAVGLRTSGFLVFALGVPVPEIAADVPGAIASVLGALAPFATGGSFVNLHGLVTTSDDEARPWPAATAERLRLIRERVDPAGRFRFAHWT